MLYMCGKIESGSCSVHVSGVYRHRPARKAKIKSFSFSAQIEKLWQSPVRSRVL